MKQEKENPGSNGAFIASLTERICQSYTDNIAVNHNERNNLPREAEILDNLNRVLELIFPGFGTHAVHSADTLPYAVGELLATTYISLRDLICRARGYACKGACDTGSENGAKAEEAARKLLESIPDLREYMKLDIQAAFDGDPAAKQLDEIVLSYPGVKAITIQRIAHNLYHSGVPMIPRMMTEYAHRITGIDIHPGAHLGKGLFIDHGTGVVIGETAHIGNDVKIYQGVTLGGLSTRGGQSLRGKRRHPTIEDNVTIYANASILGGETIVGQGCVIGASAFITKSVPPCTTVSLKSQELQMKPRGNCAGCKEAFWQENKE